MIIFIILIKFAVELVLDPKDAGITINVKNAFLVLIVANLLVGDAICINEDFTQFGMLKNYVKKLVIIKVRLIFVSKMGSSLFFSATAAVRQGQWLVFFLRLKRV